MLAAVPVRASERLGVVMMHGKWATPGPRTPVGRLAAALKNAGLLVDMPEMPWSRSRAYDRDYEGAMTEIDAAVARLRAGGAGRVAVAGHSLGANAAIGYGARRTGIAGIVALAPGHRPESRDFLAGIEDDLIKAREMVAAGKGDETVEFADRNQGRSGVVRATARAYVSFFEPAGPAAMPKNAAALKAGTPLLWMVGAEDSVSRLGPDYAFAKAPPHPKSAYVTVGGGHRDTPEIGAQQVAEWLGGL
ncbi:MAG: alpha/beta hydrolase [Rhodospirillales bacterium]|nr:alpha/beta hydrolase [Rhodospirillales bacterium]